MSNKHFLIEQKSKLETKNNKQRRFLRNFRRHDKKSLSKRRKLKRKVFLFVFSELR